MVQGGNESFLRGINFAALVMDGVDQDTLQQACRALEEVGAIVRLVSERNGALKSEGPQNEAEPIEVQLSFEEADPQEFSAVLIPDGAPHAERLRRHAPARQFIADIAGEGKPIAALGAGIFLLLDAGLLQGRTVAGPAALKNEAAQAGASWSDQPAHTDGVLITGSGREALEEFVQAMLAATAAHVHQNVQGTEDEKSILGPSS